MKATKRVLSVLLAVVMVVCAVPVAYGANIVDSGTCGDNLTWTLDSEGLLTISGIGAMTDYGNNTIPWKKNRQEIKTVMIENRVTNIGDFAFYGCDSLSSMTIGNSVTSIGDYAFYECKELTNLTIPDSVTNIGSSVFYSCSGLQSVIIGNNVTNIGGGAFVLCSELTSIIIPNSVTNIGDSTFKYCYRLTSVTIGNGITTIPTYTFYECRELEDITIPDSVISINDYAFGNCKHLMRVTISDDTTNIGNGAFWGCNTLSNVYYHGSVDDWAAINIDNSNDYLLHAKVYYNTHTLCAIRKNETNATCTDSGGYDEIIYCDFCGKVFRSETIHVESLGHLEKTYTTNSTCTDNGFSITICTRCGEMISSEILPRLNHTLGEAIIENEVAATCKAEGSYDTVVYCTECGEELNRTTIQTDRLRHVNADPVKEKEVAATCATAGSYDSVTYCRDCGTELNRETVPVKKLDHTPGKTVNENEKAPSCDTVGTCDTVIYCVECGSELSRETVTTNALGHTDETGDGYCDRCGEQVVFCPWCGGVHVGFFAGLIAWFHSILARIFGARY